LTANRAEILIEVSAPPAPHSQLSYDEYPDRSVSVGRWDGEGGDSPPALICQSQVADTSYPWLS